MGGRKVIVTLAIGETYRERWLRLCAPSWQAYAQRHDYDLVCFTTPLDQSERAQQRSPAWQKCLILGHPQLRQRERVVWIDSDIVINPDAPDLCNGIPLEHVGAVDEFSSPTPQAYRLALERFNWAWQKRESGIQLPEEISPAVYYQQVQLPATFDRVVQTGVMVLSPLFHRDLLELVYYKYEDFGAPRWNYEMRFLSYELMERGRVTWMDPRFNAQWMWHKALHAPELLLYRPGEHKDLFLRQLGLAYQNNYFLHFAGCALEMEVLPYLFASE